MPLAETVVTIEAGARAGAALRAFTHDDGEVVLSPSLGGGPPRRAIVAAVRAAVLAALRDAAAVRDGMCLWQLAERLRGAACGLERALAGAAAGRATENGDGAACPTS